MQHRKADTWRFLVRRDNRHRGVCFIAIARIISVGRIPDVYRWSRLVCDADSSRDGTSKRFNGLVRSIYAYDLFLSTAGYHLEAVSVRYHGDCNVDDWTSRISTVTCFRIAANNGMQRSGGGVVSREINVNFRRPLIPDVSSKRKYIRANTTI